MSLKGGKLIWFNKKDKREKIIKLKNKKNFKFGYYMTNDFILENPKSKPVQCEIIADAFNRISIVNCSKQNPISLNGFPVKTRRPLLHGNKIKIFDEEFVWQFPKNEKNRSIEAKKNNEYGVETPIKNQYECIPAPSSEPWKKRNRERIKARLSAHSFVQNQGNETSEESDQDTDEKTSTSVQITKRNTTINRESNINELSKQLKLRRTFDYVTPVKKWDDTASLIKFDTSFSQNKENTRTNSLQLCKSSGTLVTSYSPQIPNDSIKSNASFAYVKSVKNTPKSVYCTPQSVLSELGNDQDIEMSLDLINFSTPRAKYIENTGSMFLIDLTTPALIENKINSAVNKTPINVQVSTTKKLKSVLKNPNASDISKSIKKVKMSLGNKERSPLQVNERNPKRLKLSATPSPTLKTFRKSLSLSCTKIVKNEINQINFTPNKAALSLENSKNFPKVVDLSDAEKLNISNKIVQGSFSSFETIDNTINLDDGSTVQEGHESSVIEVSDDSNNMSLKSLNNSSIKSLKLNETPKIQKIHKTPQSLMKKVLLSSARKVANNSSNSTAILNTASTPIHVKKLSVSFDSSGNGDRKLSNIERKSTRFSLNSSLVSITPSSNRKSIKSSSLIKSAPLNRSIRNIEKSNITTGKQRKSIFEIFNKNETQKRHIPKRHSCGNTRLAAALLTPTEIKSNKKMSRNSIAILNSTKLSNTLRAKITNTRKSTVIENHKNEETLTLLPKLNQTKSSHINNNNNIEETQGNFWNDKVFENSVLNETFSIDSDSENLETQQSDENLSMTNSENKVFNSLTKNKSSDIEKDMKRVKKNLEPNKENIEYETNIQETLKLKNSKNAEKNIPIKNRKKVSNPKVMSTPKMDGIKHLMSTPKTERTPIFEGIKETLKTPKLRTSKVTNAKTQRSSLKTPSFPEDAVNLSGIQELLKTPDESESKIEKTNNSSRYLKSIAEEETEGLDSIFKTPSAKTIMVSEKTCQSTATKKYLNSASENVLNPSNFEKEQEIEVDNPDPLFDTSLQNFQSECVSTPRTTLDTTFDKLLGKRSTTKSYSNKKASTKKEFTYTIDVNNSTQNVAKSDIQEWVENITLTNLQNFEKSENNSKMQNISSDSDAINVSGIDILNISCKTVDSVDESSNDNRTNTGYNSSTHNIKECNKQTKGKNTTEEELAFENFKEKPELISQKSLTPDVQRKKFKNNRNTMGSNQIMGATFDFKGMKEQKEKEIAFENFTDQPKLIVKKSFTPEIQKIKSRIPRKTLGNNQILNTSFDLETAKEQREKEITFEKFEEQPNVAVQKSFTPEVQKPKSRISRKTMGNIQIMDESFDLEAAKEQRETEIAFENFEEQPTLVAQKSFTPDVQKAKSRTTRKTMGNNQVMNASFDLEAAKEEREKEIAFENFKEQANLVVQKSFTPNVQKPKSRITRKTIGNNQIMDASIDLEAAKEQREKEIAFENFEEQPNLVVQKSFTPDVQKAKSRITRKTMGNNQIMDASFDLEAAREQREKEIAFENFEEQPNLVVQKSFTPNVQKPISRITRKTMGNNQIMDASFDLEAAKEQREKEIAFENFEEQPNLVVQKSFTPNVQKPISRITRKTMGNNQIMNASFDLEAAKEQREKEIAFENFEEQPNLVVQKSFTPNVQKPKSRITRKTMGNNQIMNASFDLEAAKEQREKEIAFENFEEQPNLVAQKSFTPDVQKAKSRITRKTMGNNQIMDASFDLEAAKEQREKEIAFENFEEQPNLVVQKSFTPDVYKAKSRTTRKTMGNNQIINASFDLEAAKEQREKEIAFENFEEQPNLVVQKSFTPNVQKPKSRITRKTIGNNQIMDASFDLEAAKEQREKEIAFENFEEQPNLVVEKSFTPNVQKPKSRITRKTMGNNHIMDASFDLEAAKEQREKEIAFENFEEQPNLVAQKSFTPDVQKAKSRITRKTMGNNQIMDASFDLEAAKEQREKEIAFENFEEQPNLVVQKSFTPDVYKAKSRTTRKTMGNNQIMKASFDLEAAKEQREKEIAFENFEEQPNIVVQKSFTPNVHKPKSRITRKTMGNNQIMDASFDLEAAKEHREREILFENFEEQPDLVAQKSFTPDVQKAKSRITRKTMGNNQIMDASFDLEAAKEQREKEIAFENFEEQPNLVVQKSFTPDVYKAKSRTTRKTMGNNQIMKASFDLEAAKEQREKEIAFENFEEQPNIVVQKSFTPNVHKPKSRITRKTMGNNHIMDASFDLEAAKEQREKEIAFENFEEQPNLVVQKSFTPNVQKPKSRITRKTMGNNQIMDASFDLEAAKEHREREILFENFEEQPNLVAQKSFTPDVQKAKSRITRKTMGNNQIMDASFDLEAAKEHREREILFENFEEQPNLVAQKSFTPDVQKAKSRITRKTIGNNQIMDASFDLEAAKEQREKEIAFENFEEQPNLVVQKSFTPDVYKAKSRNTRKTMGNNQIINASFDLEAAKEQREKEIAFENFEDQPNLVVQKSFTPDVYKAKSRTTRKTMGNNQIMDASFDLEAAKEQREKEIAFENFEEQPNLVAQKSFTPDVQKAKYRIARKTMGNNQIMDASFDLEAAKEQRDREIAFENFEEQPDFIVEKSFTPNVQKNKFGNTRKTMGNNQSMDTSFDWKAAKAQKEKEIAFEYFEDKPKIIAQKSFTPQAQKTKSKIPRKTIGNNQILNTSFNLEAQKEQREIELAFKNFDDQPNLISKKSFTPEVQKTKSRFTRKTIGNNQTLDESFDLQAAKEQRERELNFEKQNTKKGKQVVSTKILKDFSNTETTEIRSISNEFEDKTIETNTEIWSISSESEDNTKLGMNNKKLVGINEFSKNIVINSDIKGNHSELLEAEVLEKNTKNQRNNSKRLKRKRQSKKQVNVNIQIDSESEFQNGGELITVEYESLETKEDSLSNIEVDTDSEIENSFKKNCVDDQMVEQNIGESNNENRLKMDTEVLLRTTRRMRTQKKKVAQLNRKEFKDDNVAEIEIKEARKSYKDSENVKLKTPEIRLRRVRFISNNVENDSTIKDSVQSNVLESDSSNQTYSLELNTNITETKRRGCRGQKKKIDHLKSIENLIVKETEKSSLTDTSTTILISKTKELENNFTTDSDNKTSSQTKINRRRRIKEKDVKKEDIKDIELDSNPSKTSSKTRRQREKPTANSLKVENHLNPTISQISESHLQVEKNTESDSDVKIISPTIKVGRLRNTKLKQLESNAGSDITDVPNSSIESSENSEPNNQLDYKLNKRTISTIVDSGPEPEKYKTSKLKGRLTQKSKTVESKSNENILKEQNVDRVVDPNNISPKVKGRRGRLRRENNSETSVKILNLTNESKEKTNLAESAGSDNANDVPHSSIEHSENFEANYLLGYKLNKTPITEIIDSSSESDKNKTTSKLRGLRTQKSKIVESKSNENILKEVEQNAATISGLNKISPKIKGRRGRTRKNNSETSVKNLNLTNESKPTTNLVESHSSESLEQSEVIANSCSGVNKKTKTTKYPVRNPKESDSESNVNLNFVDESSAQTTQDSSESLGESESLIESNINKNKISVETKKRRGRATKAVKTESIENNLLKKEELISNLTETEKSGMDVDSNSDSHRTPPKTRRNLRQQKKVDEIKESTQTPTSMQEPIFKTPSSVAPKSRAARRLRSNSTSTPVMLDDNSIEHDIKIEMPGRRLRSNSITTLMIDESLPLVSEVEKDKDSDAEVNKTSPKIRGRPRRKIELNDPKIETDVNTIQKESLPIRTARRLRSNSTSTPIVLDESLTSIEKLQIEEKVSYKDHSESTVSTDENLVLSEIDTEDNKISTRKTGRNRRNAKNLLQPKITENVDINKVSKDSQDENNKFLKNIKKDVSETPEVVGMEIENEIKIAATKATRTRTNKRKLYDTEEQSNDSEPGPVIERRTTRRRK